MLSLLLSIARPFTDRPYQLVKSLIMPFKTSNSNKYTNVKSMPCENWRRRVKTLASSSDDDDDFVELRRKKLCHLQAIFLARQKGKS